MAARSTRHNATFVSQVWTQAADRRGLGPGVKRTCSEPSLSVSRWVRERERERRDMRLPALPSSAACRQQQFV